MMKRPEGRPLRWDDRHARRDWDDRSLYSLGRWTDRGEKGDHLRCSIGRGEQRRRGEHCLFCPQRRRRDLPSAFPLPSPDGTVVPGDEISGLPRERMRLVFPRRLGWTGCLFTAVDMTTVNSMRIRARSASLPQARNLRGGRSPALGSTIHCPRLRRSPLLLSSVAAGGKKDICNPQLVRI
jgi:hypothetical protein